jgi:GWxTD domain-containing protein
LVGSSLAISERELPRFYRDWLDRDVVYIISHEERSAFLRLPSNEARDEFIKRFWEIRNPTPGAPTNPYRDEHYKRLDYASTHFGHNGNGWRTDMGRIYITLGPPEQRAMYLGLANVRPMEIWFYQSTSPALPPYFYIIFYQRNAGDDFHLYSPYMDGPDALVPSMDAINDRVAALKIIDQAAGRDVARETLSLLPNEPVDMDGATSSLESDVLLNTIKSLPDNPAVKDMLNQRRQLLESVTHRVVMSGEYLDLITIPIVDSAGNTNLHYLVRLKRPDDFTLSETKDGRYYYSIEVSVRVLTLDQKEVFSQNRQLSNYMSADEVTSIKRKVFGFEGVLPLPPGKYNLDVLLSNKINNTGLRIKKEIEIPERNAQALWLTPLIPFSQAAAVHGAEESVTPFLAADLKFTPVPKEPFELVVGEPLQFFYQIWSGSGMPAAKVDDKLHVEISYGRMGFHDTKTLSEDVAANQFSPNGTMVNGKVIQTLDMDPGLYRVTVTVTDPTGQKKAYSSMNIRLTPQPQSPGAWDVADPGAIKDAQDGLLAYDRARAYLAEGKPQEALPWLKTSFDKNPQQEDVWAQLIQILFANKAYAQVAGIYQRTGVTAHTSEQTVLAIADSLERVGQLGRSIQLLESAVASRPSGPICLALARYYQAAGDASKASEMETKGRALAAESSPKS